VFTAVLTPPKVSSTSIANMVCVIQCSVLAADSFRGIFATLRDPHFFEQVRMHPELGVICWPNGADLDSDVLYSRVSGTPVPSFEVKPSR